MRDIASTRPWRFGIAWRLSVAFVGVGGLAVVACFVGWLSYARLAANLEAINSVHLPAASVSAVLSQQGGAIIATAPVLALARGGAEYRSAKEWLDNRLAAMRDVVGHLQVAPAVSGVNPPRLAEDVAAIAENLAAIDGVVRSRLELETRNKTMIGQLRWIQADLMDEGEPLMEESRYIVRRSLDELRKGAAEHATEVARLDVELKRLETFSQLNAQANLAVGLMNRIATLTNLEDLSRTMQFLAETMDAVETPLRDIPSGAETTTLREALGRLLELSNFETGIPGIRRAEIRAADEARSLLAANRKLVEQLNGAIAAYVAAASGGAAAAAAQSDAAISLGRNLLLGVAALSIVAAIGVGVFYVRRNLVSRIVRLSSAARALAAGERAPPFPRHGDDELTDVAHALAQFRDTRDEFVQAAKLAALGSLAAGVGHELNQPLAAIRSHAYNGRILIARGRTQEADTALARIEALTTRMADLLGEIKRFARKPDGRLTDVALADAVAEALSLFGARFVDEDVEILCDIRPDVLVRAEQVRLEQIFVNIVSNALDAMKEAPVRRLEIAAEIVDDEVTTTIRDTGRGVAPAHAAGIFDPFTTTKPVGAGLGLGLSMSYNIAKDFGGRLALAATSPDGSAFALTLRRADA